MIGGILGGLLLVFVLPPQASAGTIVWGGSVGDFNIDSEARPLTSDDFSAGGVCRS